MDVLADSTDVTTYVVLRLAADGTEATGLTITNIDLQYTRSGEAPAAKVDATALAATNSAHGDNQAIEIDSTDQPGLYRVDWPDAAFAAGVREVVLSVKCATAFTEHIRVNLTAQPANVTHFGGTAGTFSSGRPEVNTSHWAGTAVGSTEVRANLINIAGSAVSTSTAQLGVNAVQAGGTAWGSGAITAASIADNAIDAGAIAADAITAAKIATGAITAAKFAAGAIDAAAIADGAIDAATFAAGAINNAAVSFDGSELTAIPWNASWDAEVQSEVQDAIEANHLDHLIAVADPGGVVANSSFLAKLTSKSATPAFSSYDNTTDSLEALRDNVGTAGAGLTAADDAVISAIAALNNLSAAQVNAEVLDVLNVDTFAEPGQGNPAATTTIVAKLGYLYKAWRNRTTQTSSEYALYADDGSTKDQEAAVTDDGTTYTRAEVQTGA